MGDRRMAEIKTKQGSLYLYTHHHGYSFPKMARKAVETAKPRLGDESYWVRIVIDQMTKEARDEETGFGIMLRPTAEDEYNNGNPSLIIDATTGTVEEVLSKRR